MTTRETITIYQAGFDRDDNVVVYEAAAVKTAKQVRLVKYTHGFYRLVFSLDYDDIHYTRKDALHALFAERHLKHDRAVSMVEQTTEELSKLAQALEVLEEES